MCLFHFYQFMEFFVDLHHSTQGIHLRFFSSIPQLGTSDVEPARCWCYGVVTIGPWPQLHVGSRGHFWCGRHAVRRSSCDSETSETFSDRGWQSTCPPWKSHFLRHLFRSHQTSGFEWIWMDLTWPYYGFLSSPCAVLFPISRWFAHRRYVHFQWRSLPVIPG